MLVYNKEKNIKHDSIHEYKKDECIPFSILIEAILGVARYTPVWIMFYLLYTELLLESPVLTAFLSPPCY